MRLTIARERGALRARHPAAARADGPRGGPRDGRRGPAQATEVRLIDFDMPVPGLGLKSTATGPDGRFSFESVAPGRYRVQARTGPITQMIVDDSRATNERHDDQFQAARVEGPDRGPDGVSTARHQMTRRGGRRRKSRSRARDRIRSPSCSSQVVSVSGRVAFDGPGPGRLPISPSFRVALNSAGR